MSTHAQLRAKFYLTAADDGAFWNSTEVSTWLNEAQADFAIRTLSVREAKLITLTAGTALYELPPNTIRILRVTHDKKPLHQENEPRLDRLEPTWETATPSTPKAYLYGLDGADKVKFYPAPDAAAAVKVLNVSVALIPADLSGDTDISKIPDEYHHALVLYALSRAFLKEGDTRNPEKASIFWQQYEDQIDLASDQVTKSMNRSQLQSLAPVPRDARR
jgi:hypothetical protein